MSDQLAAAEDRLLETLADSARGPKRNGVFALWMFTRVCDGLLPPHGLSPRVHRRRLQGLDRRLSSLSLPGPLKRALASGLRELAEASATAAAMALHRLVAPTGETLGDDVADVIGQAARIAKDAAHERGGGG